ncbi:MAG: tetratricopeptide repeat protein [Rikenellaceae bacterium]
MIRRVTLHIAFLCMVVLLDIAPLSAQYNRDYFLWISQRLLIKEEYREAVNNLNSLIRVDSRSYEAYFLRAIAKYNMGDLIGAENDLTQAIEYNPVYTMAYTYRAIARSRLGDYDDALKDFAEAIELRPDIPDAYYSRGVTRLLNQQFKSAIEDFNLFIIHQPKVADAYINRGLCYINLRDTVAAYRDFDLAIYTNTKSPEGYSRRGSLLLQQSKNEEAIADLSKAITNDSTHIISLFNRALAHHNTNQFDAALEDLDRVIAIDSTNSLSYFNRAIMLSQVGDLNSALDDYNQVAHLSPDNVLVYFYRANLLSRLGEIERAERDYSRAIELYPDFANAYLMRSNVRYLLDNSFGAIKDKEIADRKIADHRSKLKDSTYSIYSDTTYKFDKLLSFDTKLSGSSFVNNSSLGTNGDIELIDLYRFTLIKPDSIEFSHREYYDPRTESMLASLNIENLTLDHRESNLTSEELSAIAREESIIRLDSWDSLLQAGVAQSLIKQYTSSIETLTRAITLEPNNPYLYLCRSAIRAKMIEFINTIESTFQRISIDSDPANRLNNSVKRNFDYSEALSDIDQAIALHPTLAYSHYNRGGILVLSGMLPEAYEAYTEAIKLYPNFAEAYYNRAVVQIMMKDVNKGMIDLSKAGELGVERVYELLRSYSK